MACIRKRRYRWVIDFYDQEGKRHWLTMPGGSTRNEANERLGEMEKKIRQGVYTPVKELPYFSEVADSYLTSKQANIRHSTHEQYKGHVKNHLKPYFEKVKINHINFDAIEKFKQHSLAKGVSPTTLCKILITLGAVLTHAVRMHFMDFNPAREVERPKGNSLHGEKDEMIILKPGEIRALLDASLTQKDRVLFMTAVFTGERKGELLGSQWGDVDWPNSQALVRRTFNHGEFMERKSKASRRRIDLAPQLLHELKKWKLACPKGELDLIFPSENGTLWDAAHMIARHFFPALRRAGLPRMRFHNLRHTYASLLIAQGEHPKYIQTQLGHSSINVTMDIYGHLMDTVNRKAASLLGRSIMGGTTADVSLSATGVLP